jgi:hypothetical protein
MERLVAVLQFSSGKSWVVGSLTHDRLPSRLPAWCSLKYPSLFIIEAIDEATGVGG